MIVDKQTNKGATQDGLSNGRAQGDAGTLVIPALLFIASFVLLFLGMARSPNIYDEGIVLTAAMRVAAGQLPHRDFYSIYGPAQYYILAGLFKLVGPSILAERLLDLLFESAIVTTLYWVLIGYCRRSVALATSVTSILLMYGLQITEGYATVPIALISLLSAAWMLPLFDRGLSRRRTLGLGMLAAVATLYRYDTGIALLAVQALVIAVSTYVRPDTLASHLKTFLSRFWLCLAGFAVVTLPPALYFVAHSSISPLINDIFILQGRNYHRGRNLPFPAPHWASLEQMQVYLPLLAIGLALYVIWSSRNQPRGDEDLDPKGEAGGRNWMPVLVIFGITAFVLYFKGIVRVTPLSMYLATVPSLVILAVLFEKRMRFSRPVRISTLVLAAMTILLISIASVKETNTLLAQRSIIGRILRVTLFRHRASPGIQQSWCQKTNPVTRGLCFLPDDGRIHAIEFIDNQTTHDQPLFVGLTSHDRVFANDNLIYFAAQRLPATRWSHYDPDLQTTAGVQTEMIHELQQDPPPYVVLDSEFKIFNEPNDSARSSGVYLLDNYIRSNYQYVNTFDEMSIWQRRQ